MISRILRLLLLVPLALAGPFLAGCASSQPARFAYPSARTVDVVDDYHGTRVADPYRWLEALDASEVRTATLEELGLASAPLERMTRAIRRGEEYRNIHAVLIVKDGRLLYEEYFEGEDVRRGVGQLGHVVFDRETRHDLRSVTKSVVSSLVGTAVGSGHIRSLDQPILDVFPEHADLATPEKRAVTLRHALDMTAGLAWNEAAYADTTNDEVRMNRSADPARFVLSRPVVTPPGTTWQYSGGQTQLLAEVVRRATGRPFLDYAREALFEPLGITDIEWVADGGRETPSAASGLRLRPRDVAKFGLLYEQQGRWNGTQVIPAEWVAASLRRAVAITDSLVEFGEGATGELGYAHQWWHARYSLPYGEITAHRAAGNGGQLVFIVPEFRLVAVVLAGRYNQFNDSNRLVLERIVPWALGLGDSTYRFPVERPVRYVSPGEWSEVALTAAEHARYAGTYDYDGDEVRIWDEGGVLHMSGFGGAGGGPIHLVPMGGHLFAHGRYEGARLTRIYWPGDRLEVVVEGDRAVRFLDRTSEGQVYGMAERIR